MSRLFFIAFEISYRFNVFFFFPLFFLYPENLIFRIVYPLTGKKRD